MRAHEPTEWERIKEENAKFDAWWESEMAPTFEKADTFTKTVAINAAFMAWHKALGLDLARALQDDIRRRTAALDEEERQLERRLKTVGARNV